MRRTRVAVCILIATLAFSSALLAQGSDKVYFFRGSEYLRYDIPSDQVEPGYPAPILGNWGNWPATWDYVDASVNWGNGKAYFFRGSEYLRYDIPSDQVDPGYPAPILGSWGNWPATWNYVDGAVNWGNGKVYFFRGGEHLRYDIAADRVDPGYPALTLPNWGAWPTSWRNYIDTPVNWGNGKAYFFRGSEYLRYDIPSDQVDPGYPAPILGNWGNWPTNWDYVDAAVRWGVNGFIPAYAPSVKP